MKQNRFLKSTIILMIGGFFTKLLGMGIKIIETRLLGEEGIGLLMLVMPTFQLCLTISQFGLPTAISTLVAKEKYPSKDLIFSIYPFMLKINLLLLIFLLVFSPYLSTYLLHESSLRIPLICIGLVLPFITSSSLIRGYFFGKERMIPHVLSNVIEDVVRIVVLFLGIPYFLQYGIISAISFILLSNIINECIQMLTLYFFLPKKKISFSFSKVYQKEILSISIPTTGSRLIGSIGYFLEPILLSYVLLKVGYSKHFMITEYGILEGYVMPLLLLPSFFTMAISQALIPVISKSYEKKEFRYARKKLNQAIFFSLMIGVPVTFFFFLFPKLPLSFLYHTKKGISYLKYMAPFFLILYIQTPLTSALQATGHAKIALRGTLFGMLLRTFCVLFFSLFHVGIWGLICAIIANVFFVTFHQAYHLKKLLK